MVMHNAFVARMRTFREGDLMRRLILPILLLPAMLAAGCDGGDDQDDTLPPIDGDPASSNSADPDRGNGGGNKPSDDPIYSPAPKGAKLNAGERAAYKAAVKDLEHWQRIERKLQAHPKLGRQMQQAVVRWTYNPYSTRFYKLVRDFKEQGVRQTGRTEVHWRVPVSVDLNQRQPKIEWRECWGDGSLKWFRNGNRINQDPRPPQQTRVSMIADSRGRWHLSKAKDAGQCGA